MDTKDEEYCFICLEKEKITSLNDIKQYYWTTCNCNENIHYSCFKKWIVTNNTCPLCRQCYLSKITFCKKLVGNIFVTAPKMYCSYMILIFVFWTAFFIYIDIIYSGVIISCC
jgi:hypothetical protein